MIRRLLICVLAIGMMLFQAPAARSESTLGRPDAPMGWPTNRFDTPTTKPDTLPTAPVMPGRPDTPIGRPTAPVEPVRLGYASYAPPYAIPSLQMERWKQEVERRTGGQVRVDTFPYGRLLAAGTMFDGVVAGRADIGVLSQTDYYGRFFLTDAVSLPLGLPNAKAGSLALWEIYRKYQPISYRNVKVLTMFTTAPANLVSSKPIRKLEDLAGAYICAPSNAAEVLKAWGARQVDMPLPDALLALQKDEIQGILGSLDILADPKIAEQCRYVTMVDSAVFPFAVVMNLYKWNGLAPEVRQVMDGLSSEHADWTGNSLDNQIRTTLQRAQKQYKTEVVKLPPDERSGWDAKTAPIVDAWVNEAKRMALPADRILADLKIWSKRYSQGTPAPARKR